MAISDKITQKVAELVNQMYGGSIAGGDVQVQKTLAEFEGDVTVVVFPFLNTHFIALCK